MSVIRCEYCSTQIDTDLTSLTVCALHMNIACPDCDGDGYDGDSGEGFWEQDLCATCNGSGDVPWDFCDDENELQNQQAAQTAEDEA